MKLIFSAFLEIVGIVVLSVGLWMLAPWLGVAVAGVGLILVGMAMDPPRRAKRGAET